MKLGAIKQEWKEREISRENSQTPEHIKHVNEQLSDQFTTPSGEKIMVCTTYLDTVSPRMPSAGKGYYECCSFGGKHNDVVGMCKHKSEREKLHKTCYDRIYEFEMGNSKEL